MGINGSKTIILRLGKLRGVNSPGLGTNLGFKRRGPDLNLF